MSKCYTNHTASCPSDKDFEDLSHLLSIHLDLLQFPNYVVDSCFETILQSDLSLESYTRSYTVN